MSLKSPLEDMRKMCLNQSDHAYSSTHVLNNLIKNIDIFSKDFKDPLWEILNLSKYGTQAQCTHYLISYLSAYDQFYSI